MRSLIQIKFVLASALCMLCMSFVVQAKTPSEYREEVAHLKEDFAALLSTGLVTDPEEIARFEGEVFEEIKEFAGDRDPIRFDGSEIVPDNKWILEKFNEYRGGRQSEEDRRAIFVHIFERLGAVEGKILELENAEATGATKDENKRRLAEILRGEEYRNAPEDAGQSIAAQIMKWLEEMLRRLFPTQDLPEPALDRTGPGTLGYVLQLVIYGAIVLIVGFLLFRFGPAMLRRARRGRGKDEGERIVLGEKIEAGRSTDDLFSEAESLVLEGRLREALRKAYIALLFGLSEERRLKLEKHKTNRDYLNELRASELHPKMSELTLQYERHWYGDLDTGVEDWDRFAGGYAEILEREGKRTSR